MNEPTREGPRTRLSDVKFGECLRIAKAHLRSEASIRNSKIRELSGIGYDQAISFFNRAILEGHLIRQGSGGSTSYVLPRRTKA